MLFVSVAENTNLKIPSVSCVPASGELREIFGLEESNIMILLVDDASIPEIFSFNVCAKELYMYSVVENVFIVDPPDEVNFGESGIVPLVLINVVKLFICEVRLFVIIFLVVVSELK